MKSISAIFPPLAIQLACVVFLFSLVTPISRAGNDNVQSNEYIELSLDELMEVSVWGVTKSGVSAEDAPGIVTVITASDIERYGYRNLGEALRQVAATFISNDRNYPAVSIRGIFLPGATNSPVLVLVDGHRLNDVNFDEASVTDNFAIDIESIARIEVIKGPSSSAWGAHAISGVINIVLKNGDMIDGGRVVGEYGTLARRKGYAEFGQKLPNGFEFSGSLTALNSDGQRHLYFPEYDAPDTNHGVFDNNDQENAHRGFFKISYADLSFLYVHGSRTKHISTGSYDTTFNENGTLTFDTSDRLDMNYRWIAWPETNGIFDFRVYYDWIGYYGHWVYGSGEDMTLYNDDATSRLFGQEIRYSQELGNTLKLTTGIERQYAYDLNLDTFQSQPSYEPYMSTDDHFFIRSYYLDLNYAPSTYLRFIIGGRMDDYSSIGTQASPQGAVILYPGYDMTLKFVSSNAFSAPNNYEINFGDGITALGNEHLKPEYIRSHEFIVEQRYGEKRLSISLFQQTLIDMIQAQDIGEGLIQFNNFGSITNRGIEFQLDGHLTEDITGYAHWSLLRTIEDDQNRHAPNSPWYIGAAGLSIPLSSTLFLSPEFHIVGSRPTLDPSVTTGVSALANLTIFDKSLWLRGLTGSISAYNLFNSTNNSAGGSEFKQSIIPGECRTLRIQMSYAF